MNSQYILPTKYLGIKYRSRLEARWAVFLTHLDVDFEYEPQGYLLKNGDCYLPDFYLTDLKCWIEIKGNAHQSPDCFLKCASLSEITGEKVFLFSGKLHEGIAGYLVTPKHIIPRYAFREDSEAGKIYLSNRQYSEFKPSIRILAAIHSAVNERFDHPQSIRDGMIEFVSDFTEKIIRNNRDAL